MTGLDCLREELEQRGFTKSQIDSKVVPAVLDIIASSGSKYSDMWKSETDASKRLKETENTIRFNDRRIEMQKALLSKYEKETKTAMEHRKHCEDYIDEFNKSLRECETQEGRDAMRIAQMYVNSVDVDTKYDNTAYIVGLAAILSRGGINAINELHKINKKLPTIDNWTII